MVRSNRGADRGFTMLEVMVAMVLSMIGLIGTVAVQQAIMHATHISSDAMIAMRLSTQRLEQFNAATTSFGPPRVDELAARAAETGAAWSVPEYLDANGGCATGTSSWTATCRWKRQWKITNTGMELPYNLSVQVTYNLDSGAPKVVRIDAERQKNF